MPAAMPDDVRDLWKFAPVAALFFVVIWIWYKVMIDKLERVCQKIERERDEWKKLAHALMEKCGHNIPADLLPRSTTFRKEGK